MKSVFCDGYQDCPDGGDENEDICKGKQKYTQVWIYLFKQIPV